MPILKPYSNMLATPSTYTYVHISITRPLPPPPPTRCSFAHKQQALCPTSPLDSPSSPATESLSGVPCQQTIQQCLHLRGDYVGQHHLFGERHCIDLLLLRMRPTERTVTARQTTGTQCMLGKCVWGVAQQGNPLRFLSSSLSTPSLFTPHPLPPYFSPSPSPCHPLTSHPSPSIPTLLTPHPPPPHPLTSHPSPSIPTLLTPHPPPPHPPPLTPEAACEAHSPARTSLL